MPSLAHRPLVLVLDGSAVGRGCVALMLSVLYRGRALPVTWKDATRPIYLVSNLELADEACQWYRKRFHIETFFSDQKSRGFHIHKSHLSNPERLFRLLMAACLAYLWLVYLGTLAHVEGWVAIVHRTERCDLSLFQPGLRLL